MAITRAQQVRQMLRRGSNPNKQEVASEERTRDPRGGGRDVSNDFGQFERRQRQNEALKGTGFLGKDQGMNVGPQKNVLQRGIEAATEFSPVFNFLNALSTNRTNLKPVDLSMAQRDGRGGILPLWAQLGFNSEEEFQAAQRMAQASSNMDQEPEDPEGLRLRFMAEGGPIGGIMDIESGRQMYFLGKLVKKATRAVKKIVKSPIGKAALGFAAFKFGPGIGTFLKDKALDFGLYKAGEGLTGKGMFSLAAALTAAPLLFQQEEEDDPMDPALLGPRLDIPGILANPYQASLGGGFRRTAADGGRTGNKEGTIESGAMMSEKEMKKLAKSPLYKGFKKMYGVDPSSAKDNPAYDEKFSVFETLFKKGYQKGGDVEPVAKKTMPLLDMDGQEMDLRDNGGFVPIGRMEKADDVPARLSKNEFVFTADAVRNAGDGDIDKGAEVMYNMMKNLEDGGNVSEESQGLEGARNMFQTAQRLEEVL